MPNEGLGTGRKRLFLGGCRPKVGKRQGRGFATATHTVNYTLLNGFILVLTIRPLHHARSWPPAPPPAGRLSLPGTVSKQVHEGALCPGIIRLPWRSHGPIDRPSGMTICPRHLGRGSIRAQFRGRVWRGREKGARKARGHLIRCISHFLGPFGQ